MIKEIPKTVVHRICSGQVILNLATAVKELVENSLDAGARNIEIRLKEYGSEMIEVADNGSGVAPEDYDGLCMRYATSKIREFADLESVQTLGFRGEALSSLCAVAEVSVMTRTQNEQVGMRLRFDSQGVVSSREQGPRAVGTTTTVMNLFKALPVRHKELQRNLKSEYAKLITLLQAYALSNPSVRFICTNQVGTGARQNVISTTGGNAGTVRTAFTALFGAKSAAAVQNVDWDLSETVGQGARLSGLLSVPGDPAGGRASGDRQFLFVNGRPVDMSKATKVLNDAYRSLTSPAAATSRPVFVLNLTLAPGEADVNLTPDKRKVLLTREGDFLTALEQSVSQAWEPSRYTFKVNDPSAGGAGATQTQAAPSARKVTPVIVPQARQPSPVKLTTAHDLATQEQQGEPEVAVEKEEREEDVRAQSGRDASASTPARPTRTPNVFETFAQKDTIQHSTPVKSPTKSPLTAKKRLVPSVQPESEAHPSATPAEPVDATLQLQVTAPETQTLAHQHDPTAATSLDQFVLGSTTRPHSSKGAASPPAHKEHQSKKGKVRSLASFGFTLGQAPAEAAPDSAKKRAREEEPQEDEEEIQVVHGEDDASAEAVAPSPKRVRAVSPAVQADEEEERAQPEPERDQEGGEPQQPVVDTQRHVEDKEEEDAAMEIEIEANIQAIEPPMYVPEIDGSVSVNWTQMASRYRSHVSRIVSLHQPQQPGEAVQEGAAHVEKEEGPGPMDVDVEDDGPQEEGDDVEKTLKFMKEDFPKLKIIGQFNLGFIICRLGPHLFIVDQHASDEKATFERLVDTTVLNKQPLVVPRKLEIGPAEEVIIRENMDVFKANGFDFCDASAPTATPVPAPVEEGAPGDEVDPLAAEFVAPSGGLMLTAVPYSKQTVFGPEDVIELVHLLGEGGRAPMAVGSKKGVTRAVLRPSRVRDMLASRACRSSIMIGRHLDRPTMRRILNTLALLRAPWNCPHGRPTMRQLTKLPAAKDFGNGPME